MSLSKKEFEYYSSEIECLRCKNYKGNYCKKLKHNINGGTEMQYHSASCRLSKTEKIIIFLKLKIKKLKVNIKKVIRYLLKRIIPVQ